MKKVITYGTFDLFHQGHYNLLKRAKELGDYLIVGVTTDRFDQARGKVNVVDSLTKRIENVRRTGFADEIIIEDHQGQKIEDVQKYGVDVFTLGSDWVGAFDYLNEFCQVVYLERTPDISSTLLRESKLQIIRVGLVGTGRMASCFMAEAKYVSSVKVVACFNPEVESGLPFAEEYRLNYFKKDYEMFLLGVDAVYVATPNETHYEYTKKALQKGKHVLCEKPVTFTEKEIFELYDAAESNTCVLLEGIKTAYCPGFQQLLDVALSGKIGEIRRVEAGIMRQAESLARVGQDEHYCSSFLEFGAYTLLPIMKMMGVNYKDVEIDSLRNEKGVDICTKVSLHYGDEISTAKNEIGENAEGQLVIEGTKGSILVDSPWWLTERFVVSYEGEQQTETYEPAYQGDGLRYEISAFVGKINNSEKDSYKLTKEESMAIASITELFMRKKED
jgi:glycerol-3-phosphate cytidylyltransferase